MSASVTRQMQQQCTSSACSPGFGLCSEVDQLAFLHGALQPLSLRCQGRFLFKGTVPCGIPFCLHMTSVNLVTALWTSVNLVTALWTSVNLVTALWSR